MVDEVEGAVSFSWRPDGVNLAVARDLDRGGGYYGRLALIDVVTSSQRTLLEEPLLCFFWSPDGSKIAYIAPSDDAQGSVRWGILDWNRATDAIPPTSCPAASSLRCSCSSTSTANPQTLVAGQPQAAVHRRTRSASGSRAPCPTAAHPSSTSQTPTATPNRRRSPQAPLPSGRRSLPRVPFTPVHPNRLAFDASLHW